MKTLYFVHSTINSTTVGYRIPKGNIVEIISKEIYLDVLEDKMKYTYKLKLINYPITNIITEKELSNHLIEIDLTFIESVFENKFKTNYPFSYWEKLMVDVI